MEWWGGRVAGGRGRAGEVKDRALLFVPLDGVWELHDVPWESADGECNDSYWSEDEKTSDLVASWDVQWVSVDDLRDFVTTHFHDLDAATLRLNAE